MGKRPTQAEVREAMRILGAVGGSQTSAKKTAACRANAKKPRPGARGKRKAA